MGSGTGSGRTKTSVDQLLLPDEVILGNCMGPGGDVARVALLAAGLPVTIPGLTVDRQCGSGLAAVVLAADQVRARGGIVIAGGVESASTQPWRSWPPVADEVPVRYTRAPFAPADRPDPEMGEAADALAAAYGISRTQQDAYAARSHARAVATAAAGGFDAEIVGVAGLTRDERPSPRLTVERLARLAPAFGAGEQEAAGSANPVRDDAGTTGTGNRGGRIGATGTVTLGNACGINDGAAAVVVVDPETRARAAVPGLEVLASATVGVPTDRPGFGIVPAVECALDLAGLGLDDMDVIEFNEAFAGQVLACCAALQLDPERVCPQGGALALGHPWGASGAVLLVRLFSQLVTTPRPGAYGLAAIAVGGGQGVAMVVRSC
jgi:acetyl-CoA C-acetyltransferase